MSGDRASAFVLIPLNFILENAMLESRNYNGADNEYVSLYFFGTRNIQIVGERETSDLG
ncbi:hypothetical protein I4100191B2_14370 [Clostridiales bacterium]